MDSVIKPIGHDENALSSMYRSALALNSHQPNVIDAIAVNSNTLRQIQRSKITVSYSDEDIAKRNLHLTLAGVRVILDESLSNGQIRFDGSFDPDFVEEITGEKLP